MAVSSLLFAIFKIYDFMHTCNLYMTSCTLAIFIIYDLSHQTMVPNDLWGGAGSQGGSPPLNDVALINIITVLCQ